MVSAAAATQDVISAPCATRGGQLRLRRRPPPGADARRHSRRRAGGRLLDNYRETTRASSNTTACITSRMASSGESSGSSATRDLSGPRGGWPKPWATATSPGRPSWACASVSAPSLRRKSPSARWPRRIAGTDSAQASKSLVTQARLAVRGDGGGRHRAGVRQPRACRSLTIKDISNNELCALDAERHALLDQIGAGSDRSPLAGASRSPSFAHYPPVMDDSRTAHDAGPRVWTCALRQPHAHRRRCAAQQPHPRSACQSAVSLRGRGRAPRLGLHPQVPAARACRCAK